MAVVINATVGSASANSYLTLAEATAIIDGLVESDAVQAWTNGQTDGKNRALFTAAQRLDRERFLGARTDDVQALQWPRSGVRKPDTYINTYAVGFPFRITTDYFDDDEIPSQIKYAQAYLAAYLHHDHNALELSGLEDYKSVSIGSISVTTNTSGAVGADKIPPMVERYLIGLRLGGPGNIAIRRS